MDIQTKYILKLFEGAIKKAHGEVPRSWDLNKVEDWILSVPDGEDKEFKERKREALKAFYSLKADCKLIEGILEPIMRSLKKQASNHDHSFWDEK